jgi:hypothetical protein
VFEIFEGVLMLGLKTWDLVWDREKLRHLPGIEGVTPWFIIQLPYLRNAECRSFEKSVGL